MGNCLERSRGGGDGAVHYAKKNPVWVEEGEGVVMGRKEGEEEEAARKGEAAPPASAATEVKIRITRKQLEELLRRVEDGKRGGGDGAPVQEVVSELLSVAGTSSDFRHRAEDGHWRPSLQSIPE